MRALAVLVLCAGFGSAAPVPPAPRVQAGELCGAWAYQWGGTPGVMWLHPSGAYLACHGSAEAPNYAGVWWMSRGRVVLVEYMQCDGFQRANANRFEFDVQRIATGYALQSGYGTRVTLARGE